MMKKILIISTCLAFLCTATYGQLGSIDPDFNVGTGFGVGSSTALTILQQSDGKLLVGGGFKEYNGSSASYIARINLDGSIDNSFNTGSGFDGISGYVTSIAIQPDGKLVVGGNFIEFNGVNRQRIARLNSDGSLDTSFDPLTGFNSDVNSIAVQADGKIIVVGGFTSYDWLNNGGISVPGIVRLNQDGSLDGSFNPLSTFNTKVHILPDGKILTAGGGKRTFNGVERFVMARLNTDGSLDTTFDTGNNFVQVFGSYGSLFDMKVMPNGKIMIAGNFRHAGADESGIVRLNEDGSLDSTFMLKTYVTAVGIQSDGKVLLCETGPYVFKRHNADGSLDTSFPETTLNNAVESIIIQTDGQITLVGSFSYNPSGIMRLIGDTPSSSNTITANNENFNIYPNPTADIINIKAENSEFLLNLNITLYNLLGQQMKQQSINSSFNELNVSDLPKGIYVYSINNSNETIKSGKIIIK
jgi:uncharacterized delta-60 repeat protein